MANLYFKCTNYTRAAEEARRYLEHYNDNKIAYFRRDAMMILSRVYFNMKEYTQALKHFTEYIRLYPQDYRGYYYIGRIHSNMKEYALAVTFYNKALSINPYDHKSLVRRYVFVCLLIKLNSDFIVKSLIIKFLFLSIDLTYLLRIQYPIRSLAYHHLKANTCADQDLLTALRWQPFYPKAWNARGILLHGLRKYAAAVACYQLTNILNPFYFKSLYNEANLYLDILLYQTAIEYFTKAIAIHSLYGDAYFNRGTGAISVFLPLSVTLTLFA